jgi:dihydropteroate synthase
LSVSISPFVCKRRKYKLKLGRGTLLLGERTLVMGVLNVTPDSFSDGGNFLDARSAVAHALAMEKAGADLIDIGAESTRPGSLGIGAEEELRRLLPVLEGLRGKLRIAIAVDTRKAVVAEAALRAGAQIINDVSGLRYDRDLARVAARYKAPLILMHMRGEPHDMQKTPFAREVMKDVLRGLRASVKIARDGGVAKSQIVVDPGIGFGKSFAQNYEVLRKLPEIARLGYPLLVGTSRKGFLGKTLARDGQAAGPQERIWGTAATVTASILGGAHIVRVHDVAEMVQVSKVADAMLG